MDLRLPGVPSRDEFEAGNLGNRAARSSDSTLHFKDQSRSGASASGSARQFQVRRRLVPNFFKAIKPRPQFRRCSADEIGSGPRRYPGPPWLPLTIVFWPNLEKRPFRLDRHLSPRVFSAPKGLAPHLTQKSTLSHPDSNLSPPYVLTEIQGLRVADISKCGSKLPKIDLWLMWPAGELPVKKTSIIFRSGCGKPRRIGNRRQTARSRSSA